MYKSMCKFTVQIVQGVFAQNTTLFFLISKKLFVAEYCDWSHFKDCSLDYVFLEFDWSREKIS